MEESRSGKVAPNVINGTREAIIWACEDTLITSLCVKANLNFTGTKGPF